MRLSFSSTFFSAKKVTKKLVAVVHLQAEISHSRKLESLFVWLCSNRAQVFAFVLKTRVASLTNATNDGILFFIR